MVSYCGQIPNLCCSHLNLFKLYPMTTQPSRWSPWRYSCFLDHGENHQNIEPVKLVEVILWIIGVIANEKFGQFTLFFACSDKTAILASRFTPKSSIFIPKISSILAKRISESCKRPIKNKRIPKFFWAFAQVPTTYCNNNIQEFFRFKYSWKHLRI